MISKLLGDIRNNFDARSVLVPDLREVDLVGRSTSLNHVPKPFFLARLIKRLSKLHWLSLATRLLGIALSLTGGVMMGYAQGIETVSNAVGNIIFNVGVNTPGVGVAIGDYVDGLVELLLTPNNGTYWVFGVLLAFFGLVLIGRGDRKPRDPLESVPLLSEPYSAKLQE